MELFAASSARARRTGVLFSFLFVLAALVVREYIVNIRPHDVAFAVRQGLLGYWKAYALIAFLLASVFSATVLAGPWVERATAGLARRWRRGWTAGLLVAISAVLCGMMMLFSNRQFGAFDQSVIVDTLWRQSLGQTAYRDFFTTNPPLFVLGLRLGAFLFGVNWNAEGWVLCLYSVVTLPWMYALLRRLRMGRFPAMLLAVSAQVSALVVLSFWWYNNVTAVAAGLFLLSVLRLLEREESRWAQASYTVSLALLTWVKANEAGLMGVVLFVLLLAAVRGRVRLVVLSAGGLLLSAGTLLLCGVSPMDVLRSYASVARTRGLVFPAFHINPFFTAEAYFQLLCLGVVLVAVVPALWGCVQRGDRGGVAYWMILVAGGAIGLFALASNGDLVDVGLAPVVLAVGVAVFGGRLRGETLLPVFYTALFVALLSTQLYKGESRMRMRVIGPYFEQRSQIVPVQNRFFRDMRTGKEMNSIDHEIQSVLESDPGRVFFTSRLEWAYAGFHLPSPTGLPVFYDAGTSYDAADEPKLLARWESLRFRTVIQPAKLSNGEQDWIHFPVSFRERLAAEYDRDDRTFPNLVVWRRRAEAAGACGMEGVCR